MKKFLNFLKQYILGYGPHGKYCGCKRGLNYVGLGCSNPKRKLSIKSMKTLKELIIDQKCRKGNFYEIDGNGPYWLCGKSVLMNEFLGCKVYLRFLHYFDGLMRSELLIKSKEECYRINIDILFCTTIEEVLLELYKKTISTKNYINANVYSNEYRPILIKALENLGLPMGFDPPR